MVVALGLVLRWIHVGLQCAIAGVGRAGQRYMLCEPGGRLSYVHPCSHHHTLHRPSYSTSAESKVGCGPRVGDLELQSPIRTRAGVGKTCSLRFSSKPLSLHSRPPGSSRRPQLIAKLNQFNKDIENQEDPVDDGAFPLFGTSSPSSEGDRGIHAQALNAWLRLGRSFTLQPATVDYWEPSR